jgi:Animal haem peroxidase
MEPYSVSGQNRYCRLLKPRTDRPGLDTQEGYQYFGRLFNLVTAMTDDGSTMCVPQKRVTINAGYTYFGQFVDHDLTGDTSQLNQTWELEPEEIENRQNPRLDLGHVYGRGPWDSEDYRLYDGVRLKIGEPPPGSNRAFDVACGPDGRPLVADDRALENVILRQMTALFCCLHNLAVEQFRSSYSGNLVGLFNRARLQTSWQFQRLVVGDYLWRVLDSAVFTSVFQKGHTQIRWNAFSIPVEFSAAAMRFGHSMVRERYFLGNSDFDLGDLLKHHLRTAPLTANYCINWGRFIQNAGPGTVMTAQPIDTGITNALHAISIPTIMLFNAGPNIEVFLDTEILAELSAPMPPNLPLPFLSLARGVGLRLPSGQDVAAAFGETPMSEDELMKSCEGKQMARGDVLHDNGLTIDTPLWFYLLKESEVRQHGNCLGPTASHIVAETIYGALLHDPDSYINHPDAVGAKLEWDFPSGKKQISRLRDLLVHSEELFRV